MQILVDSSIWIDYFRDGINSSRLDYLIDETAVILSRIHRAELIPFLRIKNQREIISLLNSISKLDLVIGWEQIIDYQLRCLKQGINGIGLPDLIIAQNAIQNHCKIYSLDNHFKLMKKTIGLKLTE